MQRKTAKQILAESFREVAQTKSIDKITVWDSGAKTADGKSTTADFISGLYKSIPPLNEMFDMAGMKLPEYLGTEKPADKGESDPDGRAE